MFQPELNFLFFTQLSYGHIWMAIAFVPLMSIVFDFSIRCWNHVNNPSPVDIVMEIQQQRDLERPYLIRKDIIQKNV